MKQDMIVILDLGSHHNTVVARAIRALGVYSEIYPHDITAEELKALPGVKGVIINGGENNVIDGVDASRDVLGKDYVHCAVGGESLPRVGAQFSVYVDVAAADKSRSPVFGKRRILEP